MSHLKNACLIHALSKLWMLVKEARRSKDKQLPIDLDDITAYIEKTVSLLVQTSNYITYLRGHNILAALSCLVQQSKEMLRGEVDLWKWHDKNFLGKKYSKHLVDSAKKTYYLLERTRKNKSTLEIPLQKHLRGILVCRNSGVQHSKLFLGKRFGKLKQKISDRNCRLATERNSGFQGKNKQKENLAQHVFST